MFDISKLVKLPEVGADVSINQNSIITIVSGLGILAVIVILVIQITKKI